MTANRERAHNNWRSPPHREHARPRGRAFAATAIGLRPRERVRSPVDHSGGGLLFRRAIVKIYEESVKLEGDRGLAPVIGVTATLKQDVDAVAQRPLGRFVRADLDYVEGVAEAGGGSTEVSLPKKLTVGTLRR